MTRPALIRTPDEHFDNLTGYPFASHYIDEIETVPGARLHYLDEGERNAEEVFLCLHGAPTWSYLYRKMIPIFAAPGHRVVVPDLIGCGKSDKLPRVADYSYATHRQVVREFVERLDLQNITLVCQDWGGLLGMTLPMEMPGRFRRLFAMNTTVMPNLLRFNPTFRIWRLWASVSADISPGFVVLLNSLRLSREERRAYDAPFPDVRYKAGARAFPALVPLRPVDDGADILRRAERWWRQDWDGDAFLAAGILDTALGLNMMVPLRRVVRNCAGLRWVNSGHYVPERGEELARRALDHFGLAAGC